MTDNFNENGFLNEDGEETKPQSEENVNNEEDVFDFLSGGSFYESTPHEKKEEEPTESIYEEEPVQNTEPIAPSHFHNSSSDFNPFEEGTQSRSYSPYASAPVNNSEPVRPQEPVRPYEFGRSNNYNAPNGSAPQNGGSSKGGKKVVFAIIAVAVIVGLFSAVKALLPGNTKNEAPTTTVSSQESTPALPGDSVQISPSQVNGVAQLNSVQVAEKASPSVVGVMTYVNGQLSGEGSGVAMSVDSSGKYTYIITCAHVISDKGVTYGILTSSKKNYEAELVAYDVRTDIGVLKAEATDIPLAEFGDSKSLKVGEPVYAIGNPGGSEFFGSFTDGIVSAIDRSISGTYTMTCIQHNAAINPGNSGGALVNSAGQVIGINSSKIAATDYEGMGFAVPMSIVKPVVDSLIQYKYVPNRPKLGIEYASVSAYQLYSMVVAIKGLPSGSLVIAGISSDSSLANTDAQVGDLIIAVNGKPMDSSDVLLDMISTGAVGDTLTLTLCRVENRTYQTKTFDVTITLIEDKGESQEETTTAPYNEPGYYYGGQSSFEDFFNEYFGF